MLNTHRFVGIDVSGDYLDVAFEGEDRVWRTGNDAGGLATLGRRLAGIDRPHVVCEATGRHTRLLAGELARRQVPPEQRVPAAEWRRVP